jgi:LPPG:FO 2-phospho-L-lactate transferase
MSDSSFSSQDSVRSGGITVLAGGVGAARFLEGLVAVTDPADVTAIVNTGDDTVFHGLRVSPDLDIVMYTLAGLVDPKQGWGVRNDSYNALEMLTAYGRDTWFLLGDRDFATHIVRTELLSQGLPLSEVTSQLSRALGIKTRLLPMTDDPVGTKIRAASGVIPFQEYFVHQRAEPDVLEIIYAGMQEAQPAPGVLEAILTARTIVFSPSNPLVSLGTILTIPGVRDALRKAPGRRIAISPIVAGGTIKGPADRMMRSLGWEVSAYGVAEAYRDILDVMVIDQADASLADRIRALGLEVVVADTIMRDADVKAALARLVLEAVA